MFCYAKDLLRTPLRIRYRNRWVLVKLYYLHFLELE
jgi:hypothetical protein